ncbi:MAG: hypothetical protein MN733_28535 [Nitrososphaera sp.]|nr:hypothetical protein [Nitrososphaera sp.]
MKIEKVKDNWWVRTEDNFIIDGPFDSEHEARESQKANTMVIRVRTRKVNDKWWVVLNEYFIISGPYDNELDALAYIDELSEDELGTPDGHWIN